MPFQPWVAGGVAHHMMRTRCKCSRLIVVTLMIMSAILFYYSNQPVLQKKQTMDAAIINIASSAIGYEDGLCSSGMYWKFIPQMPVTSVSGKKTADNTVKTESLRCIRWSWCPL
jgi:hypothetical protein